MKTHKNPIKIALLMGIAAWTMSSCQDWLTIYPQSQIVEENFWEDKYDLEGVRYAAYQQMCNTMNKLAMWGDLRSDSYSLNADDQTSDGTPELYREIRDGRMERDSANAYFDWSGVYRTINYCNKVLQHGPEVLERDKQFTNSEWLQMKAEMTGLRALNYFYLIRAFKDVPYSTKVVNNDKEVMYFGATNQLVVLDSLIADVESVKGQARNRFSSLKDTKGLITNPALYALLSDMYLWRAALHEGRGITSDTVAINNIPGKVATEYHTVAGDYQKAIDYADLALSTLVTQNDRNGRGLEPTMAETTNYGLNNCYLYKNRFDNFANGNPPSLLAFRYIFGGNSEESIFELQFSKSESREHSLNGGSQDPGGPWGNSDHTHLVVSDGTLSRIYSSSQERARDSRMWFSAWTQIVGRSQALPDPCCFKWSGGSYGFSMPESNTCAELRILPTSSSDCNWFIYRISDVMLQKAEALVALDQGAEAMRYVNAIHRRWYCNDKSNTNSTAQPIEDVTGTEGAAFADASNVSKLGNAPNPGKSDSKLNYEIAVLNERQLEFIGEGKRWFDLVRFAERHSNTPYGNNPAPQSPDPREWTEEKPITNGNWGVQCMVNELMSGEYDSNKRGALINHFKNRYGLYNLIYYKEIQAAHGLLDQNPVWNKSLYD